MNSAVPAIAAGLLCGIAGVRYAAHLRSNANRLRRWTEILPLLALILSEGSVPIPRALKLAATSDTKPDRLLQEAADAMCRNPMLSLHDALLQLLTDLPEKDTLLRMADSLMRGSRESRCLAVQQASALIAQLAETAGQAAARDARLWQTLGWTCGACLTLMLI